jgi:hypothetical protein
MPDVWMIHKMNGHLVWWTDQAGTTHVCKGKQSHHVQQFWTLCAQDVPPNALFDADKGKLACPACAAAGIENQAQPESN